MATPERPLPASPDDRHHESETGESRRASPPDLGPFRAELIARFPDREALLRQAVESRRTTRIKRVTTMALAAAVVCAGVYLNPTYRTEAMATRSDAPQTWQLADGTTLSLDASSEVTVRWHLRTRELVLERGAAVFDVGHAWRPFSVASGDVRIQDIGTLFGVRRTDDATQIVVEQGEVKVTIASQTASLLANQGVVVQGDRLGPVAPVDVSAQTAWKSGRLVFDGVPLSEAVAQMQRYRSDRIVIKDRAAAGLRLSGQYDINNLDELLRALPSVIPVLVTRQPDGTYVIASQR